MHRLSALRTVIRHTIIEEIDNDRVPLASEPEGQIDEIEGMLPPDLRMVSRAEFGMTVESDDVRGKFRARGQEWWDQIEQIIDSIANMLTEELGYTAGWNGIKGGGSAEFTRVDHAGKKLKIVVGPQYQWSNRDVIPQVHIGTS